MLQYVEDPISDIFDRLQTDKDFKWAYRESHTPRKIAETVYDVIEMIQRYWKGDQYKPLLNREEFFSSVEYRKFSASAEQTPGAGTD